VKKVISLLLVLLFIVAMVAGCGNKTSGDVTPNETVNTADNNESKGSDKPQNTTTANEANTELFGIPQRTEDYLIEDFSDPVGAYTLEYNKDLVVGMEGYLVIGEELKEGDYYKEGTNFFFWARPGKAVVIKGITYNDESYLITLEEVEKGTPQSHEMLNIVCKKPFKKEFIQYTDGTYSQNLTVLDKEVGLQRRKGEFQEVNLKNNTIVIIPSTATIPYTYTLVDVDPKTLEGLQKGDEIEYMYGNYNDTVHAVVKKADN
jgi:predicted small lipoprotein YifL